VKHGVSDNTSFNSFSDGITYYELISVFPFLQFQFFLFFGVPSVRANVVDSGLHLVMGHVNELKKNTDDSNTGSTDLSTTNPTGSRTGEGDRAEKIETRRPAGIGKGERSTKR
jgi:hypothetical protein